MKTLIENLTSDLLPNQIFQTGFSFLIILKGNSLLKLDSNVLIFIMSGTMKVSSAQQELATVRERQDVYKRQRIYTIILLCVKADEG